jgi:hypothetical protein
MPELTNLPKFRIDFCHKLNSQWVQEDLYFHTLSKNFGTVRYGFFIVTVRHGYDILPKQFTG